MRNHFNQFKLISAAVSGAAILMIAGCGGGDSGPGTTPVTTTVVDGLIQNALVCLDKNGNGICDADEVQGRTDSNGNVTLNVPNADLTKYSIIAVVGTDATDVDNGPVTVPYTMAAPKDKSSVISPLTTLVQQTVASTGVTSDDANSSLKAAMGVTVSLFDDFTKVAPPTDGSLNAKTLARMIVVTTQAQTNANVPLSTASATMLAKLIVKTTQTQTAALASAIGTPAIDNSTITKADIDKVVQQKVLELLPALVPGVLAATTPIEVEDALNTAANTAVSTSGLSKDSLTALVAVNNAPVVATVAATPTASISISGLNFTSTSSYFSRLMTASIAQNTPDAAGNTRYVERRTRSTAGGVAQWGAGVDPSRNADLHWNGTKWANCPLNFENTSGPRDALGNSVYNYCDSAETGKSKRAGFDISGKSMANVYAQIQKLGFENLTLTDPTVLASAIFPTGSLVTYTNSVALTEAVSYYPGSGTRVVQYSADVAAGVASTTACGATTFPTSSVSTLASLISSHTGTPCTYPATTGTPSSGATNAWYGNSTLNLGTISSVALSTGTAPGYYSGNTKINVAFEGTGTNPVTYLACQERLTDGSTRNCTAIGTGSYTIATRGDGRVLTLNNLPVKAAGLPTRVYVERGGFVYSGYQNKLSTTNSARLNTVAVKALLTQLGLTPVDPEVQLALTAASYQGSWDFRDATSTSLNGVNVVISAASAPVCHSLVNGAMVACTLSLTNVSSGAFTFSEGTSISGSGSANFLAGTGSGTYSDSSTSAAASSFVAQRR